MPVSPAVLAAQKTKSYASAATSGRAAPTASTSKLPARVAVLQPVEHDAEMDNDVDDEDDASAGEWQGISTQPEEIDIDGKALADDNEDDDAVMIDPTSLLPPSTSSNKGKQADQAATAEQGTLKFAPLSAKEMQGRIETQLRRVAIPPHRMTPLKRDWPKIYSPLVDECGLMVRMNVGKKAIEIKTSKHTAAPAASVLQRAVDFVTAYGLGFAAEDAVALLRMEELYVETFEIKDVKNLTGDHLGRAIGRIAGKDGKTRFTIENASRTRIVLADQKIHLLGTFSSLKIARDAICALILGSPPGKVYNGLRTVAARNRQRF